MIFETSLANGMVIDFTLNEIRNSFKKFINFPIISQAEAIVNDVTQDNS